MSAGVLAGEVAAVLLAVWAGLLFAYRDTLRRLWREPVLRHPVLIVESDDWGPGPPAHAQALARLCRTLASHRDAAGRAAVMTVAVVLAIPDNAAIRRGGCRSYARRTLLDTEFAALRDALRAGRRQGVLALQLHGLEHLWPPALMRAIAADEAVRRWVDAGEGWDTEALPSHLQSRWVDASVLPSRPLEAGAIGVAVAEEVALYRRCFGEGPAVVVPPTFVWSGAVERAWAEHGATAVVTPGRRLTARDGNGRPGAADRWIVNGDAGEAGITYLVRDVYFEPRYGHTAARAVDEVAARYGLGRPALLETHRFNFTADERACEHAVAEVDRLLSLALERLPTLRFLSASELADACRRGEPSLIVHAWPARALVWLRRLSRVSRLRKLAWATGFAVLPVSAYMLLSRVAARRPEEPAPCARHAG